MKKLQFRLVVSLFIFMIGCSLTLKIFETVIKDFVLAMTWGIAVLCLLCSLVYFLLGNTKKMRFGGTMMSIIGGTLFVIGSMVCIKNLMIAVFLPITVACLMVGIILIVSQVRNSKKESDKTQNKSTE